MKKIFCAFVVVCMIASLLVSTVSATNVNIVWTQDMESLEVGTPNAFGLERHGSSLILEENGNKYYDLEQPAVDGESYLDFAALSEADAIHDKVYLAFDVYLADANAKNLYFASSTDVGSNYTYWKYCIIEGGKLFNLGKTESVDISLGEWHTIEVYFDVANETAYVYLDGVKAVEGNAYDAESSVGSEKYAYVYHLRVHLKATLDALSNMKFDNFKLGTYDELPAGADDNNQGNPEDDNNQGSPETADHIATVIVVAAAAAGVVLATKKRYTR